jgi:hypothetical protein
MTTNIKDLKSVSANKIVSNTTTSTDLTATNLTATNLTATNLTATNLTATTELKATTISPVSGTTITLPINTLRTTNASSSVIISQNTSGGANFYDRLRLLHIRSDSTGTPGSYIDTSEDSRLRIRTINSAGSATSTFNIHKGYSAGASGTVISHVMYQGNSLPSTFNTTAANCTQWVTLNANPGGNADTAAKFNTALQYTFTRTAAPTEPVYRILCGFYYPTIEATRFLNRRIIVRFNGAYRITGNATDEWRSIIGYYLGGTPQVITSVESSLRIHYFLNAAGGGGRGPSFLPTEASIYVPANTTSAQFVLGISRVDTNDLIYTWGNHSTVEIIETVA